MKIGPLRLRNIYHYVTASKLKYLPINLTTVTNCVTAVNKKLSWPCLSCKVYKGNVRLKLMERCMVFMILETIQGKCQGSLSEPCFQEVPTEILESIFVCIDEVSISLYGKEKGQIELK